MGDGIYDIFVHMFMSFLGSGQPTPPTMPLWYFPLALLVDSVTILQVDTPYVNILQILKRKKCDDLY